MALTAQEVITDARLNLNDHSEPYYHTDADLLRNVTDASVKLSQDRPDLLLTLAGALEPVVAVTALGQTLIYDFDMKEALVNYVSYLALMTDSEDTQNLNLAQVNMQAYTNSIS